jgi:hypothetical protein
VIDLDPEIDIVYLNSERFSAWPQAGLSIRQNWRLLRTWLTSPTYADDKRAAGAWCPCALEGGGIVKEGSGPVSLLVFDVDDCGADGIDKSAVALASYAGVVVPTFSATIAKAKHRIVLLPSRALTPAEFKIGWPWMNRTFAANGIVVDQGCKNINRLYFACVARSPEAWLGARVLGGEPVDVDALLDAAREEAAELEAARARRPPPRPVDDRHRDRYVRGAIDAAQRNVASASEGGRHDVLLRESYSLARLDLSEDQIRDALLPAFVHAAGEPRRREGERAVHDAVHARTRGAA